MKIVILTLFNVIIAIAAFAQSNQPNQDSVKKRNDRYPKKSVVIVAGYYYYGRSGGEIGLGKFETGSGVDASWGALYASSEFFYDKNLFVGPKVGAYAAGGTSIVVNFIYYTNFKKSSLQFRPEIGLGADIFRIYYGRNMRITNTDFNFISKNLVGLNLYFKVKNLKPSKKQQQRLQHLK